MQPKNFVFLISCFFFIVSFSSCKTKQNVSLVIHHAKIYTVDAAFSVAEAMAISDGKIIATGTNEDILKKYESTETIDASGKTIIDTFVKPREPIPPSTTRIHGITNQMVSTAPRFAEVIDTLQQTLNGQQVIVYNAVYDRKMLHQSAEAASIEKTDWKAISRWWCAMEGFAEVYGDWNSTWMSPQ